MTKKETTFSAILCYGALIICAVIVLFTNLLPAIGINVSGDLWAQIFRILDVVKNISILIVLILGSNVYAKTTKAKWTIYIIAIIIFIVGIVLVFF